MTGRRRKGLSRIEPGALIGLAVLALAYWGTVATLIMARDSGPVVEMGPTTIRPATPVAPVLRMPPVRSWCFSDAFNARHYWGKPRPLGLALQPPCVLPVRRPDSYGILLAN